MADCIGLAGRIYGHVYEPRFSVTERNKVVEHFTMPIQGASRDTIERTERTYHMDVCTRCGGIVNRQRSSEGRDNG